MQFIVKAYDGAGKLEKRMEVRPRHLAGMQAVSEHILCAGGMLDDEGKMKGSVLIVDFPDQAALDAYIATEPYAVEHVWEKIEIEQLNIVILNPKKN